MRLHWLKPERNGAHLMVLGTEGDRICTPQDARATARHHGVEAVVLPGMAHMLMLEPEWEGAARAIADWLETLED